MTTRIEQLQTVGRTAFQQTYHFVFGALLGTVIHVLMNQIHIFFCDDNSIFCDYCTGYLQIFLNACIIISMKLSSFFVVGLSMSQVYILRQYFTPKDHHWAIPV